MSQNSPQIGLGGHYNLEKVGWMRAFEIALDRTLDKYAAREGVTREKVGMRPFNFGKARSTKTPTLRGVAKIKTKGKKK
jgi:hypothetical protein